MRSALREMCRQVGDFLVKDDISRQGSSYPASCYAGREIGEIDRFPPEDEYREVCSHAKSFGLRIAR